MESRLGNGAKAFILHTRDDHPRHDAGFSKFLDRNDAVFGLDVDGNKIAKDTTEGGNIKDNS